MGSDWRRDFRVVIRVRHPDHWSDPKVLGPLCDTISFLSEDNYVFEFEMAAELRDVDERAFFDRFSGETSRVCSGFPARRPDDVACRVLALHQRHEQAIGDVLTTAVKNHRAELVKGTVTFTSVLMMTVAPGRIPSLTSGSGRTDPVGKWMEEETQNASSSERYPRGRTGVAAQEQAYI
jgi:hypothetical protein